MESISQQIMTRLQNGETPQELINKGFKRTTVYSMAKKMGRKNEENSNDKLMDLLIVTVFLIREVIAYLDNDLKADPSKVLEKLAETASIYFEQLFGRRPPEEFRTLIVKKPE